MGQSESSKEKNNVPLPKRTFTVEFFVGIFSLITLACVAYLAVGLGGVEIGSSDYYNVKAEFDNVSGLKHGASVEIAGVSIGNVASIELNKTEEGIPSSFAIVSMKIDNGIKLLDDDIASIRTKGIIGDRYVKISRGGSDILIKEGDTITETESVVDIEDIIGKIVHSIGGDKEEE